MSLNNLGDYSDEVHLFPFRTEKLSSSAQMVLQLNVGEYVVANFKTNPSKGWFFFLKIIYTLGTGLKFGDYANSLAILNSKKLPLLQLYFEF